MNKINKNIKKNIEQALCTSIISYQSLTGGDINETFKLSLKNGLHVFAKINMRADKNIFFYEVQGLKWLAESNTCLSIPQVLAINDNNTTHGSFLILEFFPPTKKNSRFDEILGHNLAKLHQIEVKKFGFENENFIATLKQSNTQTSSWEYFYKYQRLVPLLKRAKKYNLCSDELVCMFEKLFKKLPELIGEIEPPARLHGDLWNGNVCVDQKGYPALIDPSVYAGHREIDLAMMDLFGGFSKRVWEAYQEVYPLSYGYKERISLYQLYPLLVHLNLFGKHYLPSLKNALKIYM